MSFSLRIAPLSACLVVLMGVGVIPPAHASRIDSEEDLLPRIQREHDSVKKAKYETRLAHLKLLGGIEACAKDDHEACPKLLSAFLGLMTQSWNDLKSSGRDAVKKPSGFKELDIALREDARTLDDAKRKMPLEDRGSLDDVIKQIEILHEEVFAALFPRGSARPAEIITTPDTKSSPPAQSHFVSGRSE